MKLAFVVLLAIIGVYAVSARPSIKTEFFDLDPMLNVNMFEGDILLNKEQDSELRSYYKTKSKKWKNGQLIYKFDAAYNDEQKQVIRDAMNQIVGQTAKGMTKCIRFVERNEAKHAGLPYVTFKNLSGCWSYLGRITEDSSQDFSLMLPATPTSGHCMYKGTVMHELLHALGFQHEQTRADRDNYVTVNFENMDESHAHNFQKFDLNDNSYMDTPYDYNSIMHYYSYAFSKNGQPTVVPKDSSVTLVHSSKKNALTASDVASIRKAYNCQ